MLNVLLSILASVLIQPQEDLLGRLVRELDRAGDAALTVGERLAAADAAIEARARLIAASPDDDRLAIWLVDQAAALLARLARDGTDAAVLHGIPGAEQSARAREAAGEAARLLERANEAATRAIERLTARPRPSIGVEDLAAERDVRAPFFAGRAALLRAAGAADPGERLRLAQASLDLLGPLTLPEPGAEWMRRTTIAMALAQRAAPDDLRLARAQLSAVVAEMTRDGAPRAPGQTLADATLALARLRAGEAWEECLVSLLPHAAAKALINVRPDPAIAVAGDRLRSADTVRWTVLAADAIARGSLDAWRARPAEIAPLARAVRTYDLAGDAGPDDTFRALMLERIAELAGAVHPPALLAQLPPVAAFARAVRLSRDPASRAEASRLFAGVAERSDAPRLAPDALWEQAVLAAADRRADGIEVVDLLTRFARLYAPTDPARSEAAILNAIQRAARLHQSLRDGGSDERRARARRAYLDALEVATTAFDILPDLDRWRLEHARLLLESDAAHGRALDLLESIAPTSVAAAEAEALYASTLGGLLGQRRTSLEEARRRSDPAEFARQAAEAVQVARRAVAWAGARRSPLLDRFRADLAEALVEAGEGAEAVPICRALLQNRAPVPGGLLRLKLILGRALLTVDEEAAFTALRDLVAPFDAASAGDRRPQEYWQAWTLMLELLAARHAEGPRLVEVRVQLRRLEAIDPDFGGAPWRERLTALRDRVR